MSGDIAEKARLRGERLAARDALTQAERQEKSQALTAHGASAIPFAPGVIISGFMPIRSEADIRPLMEALRTKGGRLVLPVVLDRETIVFRAFDADTTLVKTGFGTTGPGADADVLDPDILLARGRRPVLIGVAFDCQEVPLVPAEPHDVPLDAILTESGLRWFSAQRSMPDQGQKAL